VLAVVGGGATVGVDTGGGGPRARVERDDRHLRHRQRPAADDELPLTRRMPLFVLRQHPHFFGVLLDAAVRTALCLGRMLGLVEPVVVPGAAVLVTLHVCGPYSVWRRGDKPYNVGRP